MIFNFFSDPIGTIFFIIALIIGITVHEFFHAYSALLLGDPTAKYAGRVTINPLKHLDPVGSLFLLLAGFGWGKPVPINPARLKYGVGGEIITAAAGPLSNLAVALIFILFYKLFMVLGFDPNLLAFKFLATVFMANIILMVFNLLPIPPLDGANFIKPFLSYEQQAKYQQFGPFALFAIILLEYSFNIPLISALVSFVIKFITNLIL